MKRLILGIILIAACLTQLSFGDDVIPVWTRTYNPGSNQFDTGYGIAVDNSGNVYVTGYDCFTGIWTRKYDSNGSQVWTKTYQGTVAYGVSKGFGIAVDSSGNVYVTGCDDVVGQGLNIWTRKYDRNGNEVWTKAHNGSANSEDIGYGIAVDNSGNVYVTGHETVTGQGANIWTRKYDSNGNEVWTKTYNDTANGNDKGYGIAVDNSGNVYVTGYEKVTGQSANIWTRKYDSSGNEVWTKTYNDAANGEDVGWGIAVDNSGNVYVTGYETVTSQRMWTRKYDSNGNEVWTKTYNGTLSANGKGVAVDSSGNVYVMGFEYVREFCSNIMARKYDNNGNEVWTKTHNGSANSTDIGNGIAVDSSGNVYVTGREIETDSVYNIWTRKYAPQTTTTLTDTGYFKIIGGKDGYINPNAGEVANFLYKTTEAGTTVFKVYNLKNELVRTVSVAASGPAQIDSFNFDCKNEDGNYLSSGIYIIKAEGSGLALVKKLAIIK
ncbi:MAG: hypothetical protein A2231_13190 [Candidatus Firestonebacteria bacterium RIFOXYA2_FULL_40_8]|nr:MAG: hypothetical protein A2231_13190 [Candidatus Firestonebacteria bacterium RIFOXYA2_FULL_40_8]